MHLNYESILPKSLLAAQFISMPSSKLLELLQYNTRATLVDPSTRSSFLGTITMLGSRLRADRRGSYLQFTAPGSGQCPLKYRLGSLQRQVVT